MATERVKVSELLKYEFEMSYEAALDLWDYKDNGHKYVNVPVGTLDELKRLKDEKKQKEKRLHDCASRNNKGIALEKEGKIDRAIKVYESNIVEGCYPARHSFDRLMILYRKQNDYDNEIRVINRAIEVFEHESKYRDRLEKAQKLKSTLK